MADISTADKITGSKQIIEFCIEEAEALGIRLIDACWETDITTDTENNVLLLKVDTGESPPKTSYVAISKEEIEEYPGRAGRGKTETKIRDALRQYQ